MTEEECLALMVPPGKVRPSKPYRGGVIQIWVTRSCDKSCYSCTQGSNLAGKPEFITLEQFEQACISLKNYWGVVGMFGGNPCTHPQFDQLCLIMQKHIPFEQRGLWSNNLMGKGNWARQTFNPAVSNLNVHLDQRAYAEMKKDWPDCHPVGLDSDSRHSPTMVAMKDVVKEVCSQCGGYCGDNNGGPGRLKDCEACHNTGQAVDESRIWDLISGCDINQHWSAMIGVFRGELRAWFCEIAGAQSMLHQHEPDYPDTGYVIDNSEKSWWQLGMESFRDQVRKHCFDCGVPLRGHGQLSQSEDDVEQVSHTHEAIYRPKRKDRKVQVVTELIQLGTPLRMMTKYIQNAKEES